MATLKAEALLREFHYNGIRIPDPGPGLTVEFDLPPRSIWLQRNSVAHCQYQHYTYW
jgi:hypothetical protein